MFFFIFFIFMLDSAFAMLYTPLKQLGAGLSAFRRARKRVSLHGQLLTSTLTHTKYTQQ